MRVTACPGTEEDDTKERSVDLEKAPVMGWKTR